MPKILLRQYRGFNADRRMSMDIYANALSAISIDQGFDLQVVRPESALERFASSRLVMRYLRYWHYPKMVRRKSADLHHVLDHGYAHLYPNLRHGDGNAKTCISVHDLIPMLMWNGHIRSADGSKISTRKPWLNLKSLSCLANYDRIIAVSNHTKNDLIQHLGLSAEKIDVVANIISAVFQPSSESLIKAFAEKYNFDRSCKWLMISGAAFYKNHYTCLKVLADLNRQHDIEFRIVKTGLPSDDFSSMVAELGLESKVKSIFLEDTAELAQLYGLVDCLLFPSLYEGFGMPVIEALACGTPVVTSDRGSLPEVAGPLAAICDAGDVSALSKGVTSMVFDNQRRTQIAERGPDWADQFRVHALAPQLKSFYHATLDG